MSEFLNSVVNGVAAFVLTAVSIFLVACCLCAAVEFVSYAFKRDR